MGAWGAGNFENDTALDWVWTLQKAGGLAAVETAIAEVLNCGDYLDADAGCIGLAAAEVTAALRGKPPAGLPEEVAHWVETHRLVPGDALVHDCRTAVDKIRHDDASELRELWAEDGDFLGEWDSVLADLAARLE